MSKLAGRLVAAAAEVRAKERRAEAAATLLELDQALKSGRITQGQALVLAFMTGQECERT